MNYLKLVERLRIEKEASVRLKGNSMTPKIKSGDLITLKLIDDQTSFEVGDAVLVKVGGHFYCHLASAVEGDRVQISNNHGHVNGWTNKKNVFAKVIRVEP